MRATSINRTVALVAVALVFLMFRPIGAMADESLLEPPRPGQGYYLALEVTGTAIAARAHGEMAGSWLGPTSNLRLGERLLPWLDLGLGLGGGYVFGQQHEAFVGSVTLEAQLRPLPELFVRLGVGMAFVDVRRIDPQAATVPGRFGESYVLAVGYDFFPWRRALGSGGLALSPVVGVAISPSGDLATYGVFAGIEIAFWTGRPKNELALDAERAFAK